MHPQFTIFLYVFATKMTILHNFLTLKPSSQVVQNHYTLYKKKCQTFLEKFSSTAVKSLTKLCTYFIIILQLLRNICFGEKTMQRPKFYSKLGKNKFFYNPKKFKLITKCANH